MKNKKRNILVIQFGLFLILFLTVTFFHSSFSYGQDKITATCSVQKTSESDGYVYYTYSVTYSPVYNDNKTYIVKGTFIFLNGDIVLKRHENCNGLVIGNSIGSDSFSKQGKMTKENWDIASSYYVDFSYTVK